MAEGWPANVLITVLGATGTGKSKLAVNLAKRLGGEIINADAIQLYEGLPIVTNKISTEEMQGVKHHLLGTIGLDEQTWTVGKFVSEASSVIKEIRYRGKLPILVGGTHYYTKGLLFHDQIVQGESPEYIKEEEQAERWPILRSTADQIFEKLKEVDPEMASRWHPKDTRKIRRSLVIWLQTGRKASEIYAEQQQRSAQPDQLQQGHPEWLSANESVLRYNTLAFWMHVEDAVLKERLSDRVDVMVQDGLLDEVRHMHQVHQQLAATNDTEGDTRGIWVAIGYKELLGYLNALESGLCTERELKAHLHQGIERTKAATRQYAKKQLRFIRWKLLPIFQQTIAEQDALNVFPLNASKVEDWDTQVADPAIQITKSFLARQPLNRAHVPDDKLLSLIDKDDNQTQILRDAACELCGVRFMTVKQEVQHKSSRRHKAAMRRKQNIALVPRSAENQEPELAT